MKALSFCMECRLKTDVPLAEPNVFVDIPENGIIEILCSNGHHTVTVIQQTKFEILSEMGFEALVDGYYRDAVSSFASSLERLYEYFIEAACRRQGISPDVYAESWKGMASQSERQIGAFIATFMLDTQETPKTLPRKQVEFRNSVIHKGRLPTYDEAFKFGAAMFDCALPVLRLLRSKSYHKTVQTLIFEHVYERSRQAHEKDLRLTTMSLPTALSLINGDQIFEFEKIVAGYVSRRDFERVIKEPRQLSEWDDRFYPR